MKAVIATAFKKDCVIKQCYRHCSDTAIFLEKVNFILSVTCKNENKLKVTLQFPLDRGTFN